MAVTENIDPVVFSQALIRCASVTPTDAGALGVLEDALKPLGFVCHRLPFSQSGTPDVENLYARFGSRGPNLCFAGHTDVVPVGNEAEWTHPPFGAQISDGVLYGRGATDMKCGIAAFVAAAQRFLNDHGDGFNGSISFLITGDEEGPAINGTSKVLNWMVEHGEAIDACIIGEPTNPDQLGQEIKIGRRGSLNGYLTVHGTQGHVAYPHNADNPVPKLLTLLVALGDTALDQGTDFFQPSNLEITSIDVGNPATNVIAANARAQFNIRFNDLHTSDSLRAMLSERLNQAAGKDTKFDLDIEVSGEAFMTPPGKLSETMLNAVEKVVGVRAELTTSGGTSDARFIKDHAAVAEFGLMNATAHKVDENARVGDIRSLSDIYFEMISGYFTE